MNSRNVSRGGIHDEILESMLAFLHCARIAAAVDILIMRIGQVFKVYKILNFNLFHGEAVVPVLRG